MLYPILVFIVFIFETTMAQRPSFAGTRPIGVPDLASRFASNTSDSGTPTGTGLANRLGTDAEDSTRKIPVDARGDVNLVDRLASWPRENQPFWLINAEHIENQRNPSVNRRTQGSPDGSAPTTVSNRDDFGENQVVGTRGSFGPGHLTTDGGARNHFTVYMNNQLKTYVYDPVLDAWFPRKI